MSELCRVLPGLLDVRNLLWQRVNVGTAGDSDLRGRRTSLDAAGTTAITHIPDVGICDVVHDRVVIHVVVVDGGCVDVGDGAVVHEVVVVPVATVIAVAVIAVAVRNAAIVADVRTPVALVEAEDAAEDSPKSRCPERAGIGRRDPDAGDPIVAAGLGIAPVARGPLIAGFRAGGLLIFRQRRGRLLGLQALFPSTGVAVLVAIIAAVIVVGAVCVVGIAAASIVLILIGRRIVI